MKVVRWDAEAQRFAADKMQKVGLFASERFFLDLYCLEPGQTQKAHAHDGSDKVYLVVEGSGSFRVGDDTATLSPLDIALPTGHSTLPQLPDMPGIASAGPTASRRVPGGVNAEPILA